jgi:hypothetical protein
VRFLVLALGLLGEGPAGLQGRFSFRVSLPGVLHTGMHGHHAGAKRLHLPPGFLLLRGFAGGFRIDFRKLADDLLAAGLQPFGELRQTDMVQFQLMLDFLEIRTLPPQAIGFGPALFEFDFP